MKTYQELNVAVQVKATELLAYRNQPVMNALVGLLDALNTAYLHDLSTISPERLQKVQGAVQQIQSLRSLIVENNASQPLKI